MTTVPAQKTNVGSSLAQIRDYLALVAQRPAIPSPEQVSESLTWLKAEALSRSDQKRAKAIWCWEQALVAQNHFLEAFTLMKGRKFYEAWCALEGAEVALGFLERHETGSWSEFRLDFIQRYTAKWQSLFPYKLFLSPELLQHETSCSICGEVSLSPRKFCGHRSGEIYDGKMCCRIVQRLDVLGTAVVQKPIQKYSVIFLNDNRTGKERDHYNYAVVRYAVDALRHPFDEWNVERTTRVWPHSRFRHLGRNDQCPCESGRKYKKCCLQQPGVVRPHLEFTLAVPPPVELPLEVYGI